MDGEPGPFSYSRDNHPTGVACEEAIGALEGGGRSLLFPSGMGAVTTVLLTLLRPGQTIAIAEAAYYGHAQLVRLLEPWGLRLVEFDQTEPPPDDADLVLIESPANPILTMPDFEAAAAHAAPVVCDATVASPLRVRAARPRLRHRAPLRDEGARRATTTCSPASSPSATTSSTSAST